MSLKLLCLDIETAPNTVHVWGLYNQFISLNQIIDSGYVLCWAAKWYGSEEVMFDSIHQSTTRQMLKRIYTLLNEADAVVHYNGTKFDIPTLNKEFLLEGFTPPAPYKQIDLLRVARSQFRFPSNKLDYVANALGVGKKTKHKGHELWIECMAGDPAAWDEMETYNINDVVILEKVYDKLKPWIKRHPNHGLYDGLNGTMVCPNCGGNAYTKRGLAHTSTLSYQRYVCKGCGSWFRDGISKGPTAREKFSGNL